MILVRVYLSFGSLSLWDVACELRFIMVPRLPTGRPLGLRAYKVRLCVRERPWWASSGPRPSLSSLGPTAAF